MADAPIHPWTGTPDRPLWLPPMSHDDTGGISLTHLQVGPVEPANADEQQAELLGVNPILP
jgi:hypothetical protein